MTILIPLLTFEVAIHILAYAPIYGFIGLLGSTIGWGVAKLYIPNRNLTEEYLISDTVIFPDRSS